MRKGKSGEIYNISAGNEVTVIEIVRKILHLLGKSEGLIDFVDDRPGHDLRYSLDSTKLRETLGCKPEYEIDRALEETVEWYANKKQWPTYPTDEQLINIF